jgi:hypothetical protein
MSLLLRARSIAAGPYGHKPDPSHAVPCSHHPRRAIHHRRARAPAATERVRVAPQDQSSTFAPPHLVGELLPQWDCPAPPRFPPWRRNGRWTVVSPAASTPPRCPVRVCHTVIALVPCTRRGPPGRFGCWAKPAVLGFRPKTAHALFTTYSISKFISQ